MKDSTREEGQGTLVVLSICVILLEQRERYKGHRKLYPKEYEPIVRDMLQMALVIPVSENLSHLDSCRYLEFDSHLSSPLETPLQIQRELAKWLFKITVLLKVN